MKANEQELIKVVLEAQRALRPYTDAMEAATRASRSMADMVRDVEQRSGLKQLQEIMRRQETLSRAAFGPVHELRHSKIFDVVGPWQREMERVRQIMDEYQARFRLPEMTEAARLLANIGRPVSFEKFGLTTSRLQEAIGSMSTPWLDMQEKLRSIGAFAELQGIGHAVRTMPAFDESLSAKLRIDLGDWRDPITWRPEIFTDLAARSDFYEGLGFNTALTDFPLPAFEQSLDIAGLRREPLTENDDGGPEDLPNQEEEEGLERTNAAHDRLQRLERLLRKFIDERMTEAFGPDWPKRRLPNGFFDQWREKKRKAEEAGADVRPIIEYADFTDYAAVICRTDNWREIFGAFFVRQESVRESFQRLIPSGSMLPMPGSSLRMMSCCYASR